MKKIGKRNVAYVQKNANNDYDVFVYNPCLGCMDFASTQSKVSAENLVKQVKRNWDVSTQSHSGNFSFLNRNRLLR